jgi:hypothetical protein
MTKSVINLGKKTGRGTLQSPEGALRDALDCVGKNGAFEKGKKVLILSLDDADDNYAISFIQAGMRMSECNSLCDIAKSLFREEMGY